MQYENTLRLISGDAATLFVILRGRENPPGLHLALRIPICRSVFRIILRRQTQRLPRGYLIDAIFMKQRAKTGIALETTTMPGMLCLR